MLASQPSGLAMLFSLMKSKNTKTLKKELGFLDTDEEKERREKR